jgi:hypothetical protein
MSRRQHQAAKKISNRPKVFRREQEGFESFCTTFSHLAAKAITISKQAIIDRTLKAIQLLSTDNVAESSGARALVIVLKSLS